MVTLLSANACLEAEKEAAMKQAQSASNAAEAFMASGGEADKELKNKLHQTETGRVKLITIEQWVLSPLNKLKNPASLGGVHPKLSPPFAEDRE